MSGDGSESCVIEPACGDDEQPSAEWRRRLADASSGAARPAHRRRLAAATCELERACATHERTDDWLATWRASLDDWWGGLPLLHQQTVGNCLGALGLHLGSRFDAAHNAWRTLLGKPPLPPKAPLTQPEPGCEWLKETLKETRGEYALPEFPPFGAEPDAFKATFVFRPTHPFLPYVAPHFFPDLTFSS